MKTQINKLDFKKSDLVELNNSQLQNVNGGSTGWFCDIIRDILNPSFDPQL